MLTKWSVDHPIAMTMFIIGIVIFGLLSLFQINSELMPNIEFPVSTVITPYPGATSAEVEKQVTNLVEEAVGSIEGIEDIVSTSSDGSSIVIVSFDYNRDINEATSEMRAEIEQIKNSMPKEALSPIVSSYDPSQMPIMTLSIYGEDQIEELSKLVEEEIIPELEKVKGVASVSVQGNVEKRINIEVFQDKLEEKSISTEQIANAIMSQDINIPLGQVKTEDKNISVQLSSELENIEKIEDIIIRPRSTMQIMPETTVSRLQPFEQVIEEVRVKDIAEVKEESINSSVIGRFNGEPAINLEIKRRSDANTVETCANIQEKIEKIEDDIPIDVKIFEIINQADEVNDSINSTVSNAYLAALIAAFILFLFLRSIRSTLIVALSIPTSVIVTIGLIYSVNYTLNIITLGGLVMGIGMLVDNSIVVLESIFKMMEEGISPKEAAKLGTQEVSGAITTSTLTSIAVFLPMVFISGIAQKMFTPLGFTVIFALLMSLLVALTLVPMLSSTLFMIRHKKEKRRKKVAHKIREPYKIILKWSLEHRTVTIFITILLLIGSIYLATGIDSELLPPESGRPIISIKVLMPAGSSLEANDKVASDIEDKIKHLDGIDTITTSIQGGVNQNIGSAFSEDNGHNQVAFNVKTSSKIDSDKELNDLVELIQNRLDDIKGAEDIQANAVESQVHGGFGSAITVEIYGPSLSKLEELSKKAEERILTINGVIKTKSSLERKKPQFDVEVDKKKVAEAGLSQYQIASSVRTALYGQEVASINNEDGEKEEVWMYISGTGDSLDNLKNLGIMDSKGKFTKLEDLAEIKQVNAPLDINHIDEKRSISIDVEIDEEKTTLSRVAGEVRTEMEKMEFPEGYDFYYAGQYEQMIKIFSQLFFTLLVAIGFVYMIMAAQFGSFKNPFIIMFTIPLAIIGVILAIYITNTAFSMTGFFGIIILVGIVVNNAIVLIDYINTLSERGYSLRKAIIKGGQDRLRPVLMTMATTVLAMTPLAIGLGNSKMMSPLAIAVMGGLSFSTFLTLIFIPVLYSLFNRERRETRALAQSAKLK